MENGLEKYKVSQNDKNVILDYDQVQEKLERLVNSGKVRQEPDIGKSENEEIPIKCYSIGNGKKAVAITGAMHGSEIITTDLVLHQMDELSSKNYSFLKDYKIYFIPVLNPEGYIVSTSAIRKLIPRDMPKDEAEKICKEYYQRYRQDDINGIKRQKEGKEPDRNSLKLHQQMFENVDYTCIPEKYPKLREKIKSIYEKYPDLPKGMLEEWSANGSGIDIQANCKYNEEAIKKINNGEKNYLDDYRRHSNVDMAHPGPINCAFDKEKGFYTIPEVRGFLSFLQRLSNEENLQAYYNYHSTGGQIYPRPTRYKDESLVSLAPKAIENHLFADNYAEKTVKNGKNGEENYKIVNWVKKFTATDDITKKKYPRDLVIELSPMGGNPIGPYGDLEGNYKKVINSNTKALEESLKYMEISEMISNEMNEKISEMLKGKDGMSEEEFQDMYYLVDKVYDEFKMQKEKLDNDQER